MKKYIHSYLSKFCMLNFAFAILMSCADDDLVSTEVEEVKNLSAIVGSQMVTLNWVAPTATIIDEYSITYTPNGTILKATADATSLVVSGLNNGTEYIFTVKVRDNDGNLSEGVNVIATPIGGVDDCTTCYTGDLIFVTQSDFESYNSDITFVDGDVEIGGDVTDISALAKLDSVSGNFSIITNTSLIAVPPLNLQKIGGRLNDDGDPEGNLVIWTNLALSDLSGFSKLTEVVGEGLIMDNSVLGSLDGLNGLTTVGGDFSVGWRYWKEPYDRGNPALVDFCAIKSLLSGGLEGTLYVDYNAYNPTDLEITSGNCSSTGDSSVPTFTGVATIDSQTAANGWDSSTEYVHGDLTISGNVTDLSMFASLDSVSGDFVINETTALTVTTDFSGLQRVGGNFNILLNELLTDLSGFTGLKYIGGSVFLWSNLVLESLDGLDNLTNVVGDFSIGERWWDLDNNRGNSLLSDYCALQTLVSGGGLAGTLYIDFNAYNPSSGDIETSDCEELEPEAITHTGDITITSQAEANAYDATITYIDGALTIDESEGTGLTDLSMFAALDSVSGNFTIQNSFGLTGTTGFEGLQKIAGNFSIITIPYITDLAGFAGLKHIGGQVFVWDNFSLTSLDGLENLTTAVGEISIGVKWWESPTGNQGNWVLSDYCALKNLLDGDGLGSTLYIEHNGGGAGGFNPTNLEIQDANTCSE